MKKLKIIIPALLLLLLSGCAAHQLKTPCPEYGKWCQKIPVNSWNDET